MAIISSCRAGLNSTGGEDGGADASGLDDAGVDGSELGSISTPVVQPATESNASIETASVCMTSDFGWEVCTRRFPQLDAIAFGVVEMGEAAVGECLIRDVDLDPGAA
jgi:hypothetical protein